ncbi:PREDICTED: uncharacterized protein LOC106104080 [Papilio polytes]|uniref:uncharacterized protein LOC106104080 n=1 Tax=Papilio polytes TaxID=76194 RepID=UPI0006760837|nr:PREDICTED: uncharacterized protein LOC106104080 [Papilio polytes]
MKKTGATTMSSIKGSSDNGLRIGLLIFTLIKFTDCDFVSEAPKSVYQRDKPYVSNEIPEPESLPVLHGNDSRCRISEYHCANKKCIPINRFCDGTNDCGDSSDEPRHCTRCNRTYYGDIGRTYELELHRPREDLVPYVCLLTITAAGGVHGDLVQVLFDSFTLGRFTSFTEDGCPDGYMQIQEASRPQVGGSWCGTSWGPSIYYSETKSITLIIRLLHLSKEQNNYNFDFRMAYKVLRKEYATVRYGGSPPSERPFFKLRPLPPTLNISRNDEINVARPRNLEYYLGDLISGTYCSRIFSDCDRKKCRLQSPNYPGVYPRNLTCYYAVRQHEVPQGKHALIIVKQPNGQLVSIRSQKALYATAQQERGNNGRELKFWQQCDEVQDYVTVYDGYTTRDPVILRFCGGGVAVPEAISSGPELLVEFTTSPFGTFLQPATLQSLHGFQLEVEVRFVDQQSPTYAKNKRACEFWIRGTGKGVLEHPQHSLPPNTTCLYHMQGIDTSGPSGRNIIYRRPSFSAPRFRVWFSVLKFYVTNALNPNLPEDEYCGSHLNIWDGPMRISPGCSDIFCDRERSVQMSRATSPQSVIVGRPPTNATLIARFCRERAPRTCEHALLRKSRACTRTESFLSKGDSLTLELKLTQGTALKPVFFKALYEFVDLHQDGEPWGQGPCSRRFSSRSFPEAPPDPPVSFSSPRDVFLYGRGGKRNISCTYRFEANVGEVIRLRVWGIRSGGRLCRSVHSAHSPWYRCGGDPTAALRVFERPWRDNGPRVPRDCLCSDVGDYEFISKTTVAELKFDVVNMTATDDFRSFGFEATVEFVRQEILCENTHRAFGASGELRLMSSPNTELDRCEHRPWLIDPSPGRYLYLQIRGNIIKEPELDNFTLLNNITVAPDLRHLCRTPNRIAVYAGGLSPIFICPNPPQDPDDTVEIFSDGWSKEVEPLARHVLAPPPSPDHFDLDWPRSLSVELLAEESGSYYITWLELSRRHASQRGGVFALSGECQYKCASLDACIAPALWCDGVVQCPQGEDERLSECSALLRVPAHYAAAMLALTILTVIAVIAAARSCRRRRSALQHRLKSLSSDTAIFEEKEVIC